MLRASLTTIRPRTVPSQVQIEIMEEEEAKNLIQEGMITDHPQVLPNPDDNKE